METKTIKTRQLKRAVHIDFKRDIAIGASDDDRRIEVAFSSEAPVLRDFGEDGAPLVAYEVLSHKAGDVDLSWLGSGRAALLNQHDNSQQIGVVESARIDPDGIGRAVIRFSKSPDANVIYQDVVDGIRQNISVGYTATIKDYDDDTNTFVCSFAPYEISIVSVPADQNVGVGRNKSAVEATSLNNKTTNSLSENTPMTTETVTVGSDLSAIEKNRTTGILAIAREFNLSLDLASEAIANERSISDFQTIALRELNKRQAETAPKPFELGMSQKEIRSYNLVDAVRAMASGRAAGGLVNEVSRALQAEFGESRGLLLPINDLKNRSNRASQFVGTPGAGNASAGALTNTTYLANYLTLPWYANSAMIEAGVRLIEGAKGAVELPVFSTPIDVAGAPETNTFISTNVTASRLTLLPHPVAGSSTVTNTMLANSDPYLSGIIEDSLYKQMKVKLDKYSWNGNTSAGDPVTGLFNTTGVNTTSNPIGGRAPVWSDLVALEKVLANLNVPEEYTYAFNPSTIAALKETRKGQLVGSTPTATDSLMIINDSNAKEVNGYKFVKTTNIPNNLGSLANESAWVLGNFEFAAIAIFGVPELLVNPYANQLSGETVISLRQDFDFQVQRPDAFVINNDLLV
jgi:HK97 family phage major capsid protein/HK97 family phage prohead protease